MPQVIIHVLNYNMPQESIPVFKYTMFMKEICVLWTTLKKQFFQKCVLERFAFAFEGL